MLGKEVRAFKKEAVDLCGGSAYSLFKDNLLSIYETYNLSILKA